MSIPWSRGSFALAVVTGVLVAGAPRGIGFLGVPSADSSTIYALADEAFLSWFARQSPSTAAGGL